MPLDAPVTAARGRTGVSAAPEGSVMSRRYPEHVLHHGSETSSSESRCRACICPRRAPRGRHWNPHGWERHMKAAVWHGKHDVRIDEVPDPTIQEPTDA